MRFPGRRLGLVVVVLLGLVSFSDRAEACGTACELTTAPDCLGCRYTFFTRTICIRINCNLCEEDFCWVGMTSSGERLALETPQDGNACTAPASERLDFQEPIGPKILKVDVLNARS